MAIYLMPTQYPSTRIAPYEQDTTDTVWQEIVRLCRRLEDAASQTRDVDRLHQLRERGRCCLQQVNDIYEFLSAREEAETRAK